MKHVPPLMTAYSADDPAPDFRLASAHPFPIFDPSPGIPGHPATPYLPTFSLLPERPDSALIAYTAATTLFRFLSWMVRAVRLYI